MNERRQTQHKKTKTHCSQSMMTTFGRLRETVLYIWLQKTRDIHHSDTA